MHHLRTSCQNGKQSTSLFRAFNSRCKLKERQMEDISINVYSKCFCCKYRWRHLFNAAKFGWCPVLECRAVTLPRRESRWNLLGHTKLANVSQPLAGQRSPYCEDMWGRYCCLTSFFPIVHAGLSWEDIAQQSCAMVPRWRIFGNIWVLHSNDPHAAHFWPAF